MLPDGLAFVATGGASGAVSAAKVAADAAYNAGTRQTHRKGHEVRADTASREALAAHHRQGARGTRYVQTMR